MDGASLLSILTMAFGGVGVFLLGMRLLSNGLQTLAGERLNRWISAVTDNRLLAVLAGVGVTCLIQSSTATTVMVVGFVNAGIMTLVQGISVVFGAHVGTTLSLWLLTLNVAQYKKIRNAGERLTPAAIAEVMDLCDRVAAFARDVMDIVQIGDRFNVARAIEEADAFDAQAKKYRDAHMRRIGVTCTAPVKSLVYSDLLVAFRRQNDHLLNIAQTLRA